MANTLLKELGKDPELARMYQQEKLIVEVTEVISELMTKKGVNKTELSKRIGTGKSNITQLLDGTENLTLRTVADLLWALDAKLAVQTVPADMDVSVVRGILSDLDASASLVAEYKFEGVGDLPKEAHPGTGSGSHGKDKGINFRMVA